MATDTSTVLDREATRPPQAPTPSRSPRAVVGWAAVVAACVAVAALGIAACGGDGGSDETTKIAAPADVSGSDRHLYNRAEELARSADVSGSDQHLANRAEQIARAERANKAATARLEGQAEQYERSTRLAKAEQAERQAHLDGQARTYGTDR